MAYARGPIIDADKYTTAALTGSSYQFTLVKTTAADTVTPQVTAGGVVYGILYNLPAANEVCEVAVGGIAKVRVTSTAHTAIAVFDKLCASSSGTFIGGGAKGSTAVANFVFGRAMEALAANTTGVISCLMTYEGSGSTGAAATP